MIGSSSLSGLPFLRDATRGRASSYDRTGGNADFWMMRPGETRTLAQIAGPGCVRHIWMTLASREEAYLRRSVLRMFWDGARDALRRSPDSATSSASATACMTEFSSMPLTMSPRDGRGFNCFFPMPFAATRASR